MGSRRCRPRSFSVSTKSGSRHNSARQLRKRIGLQGKIVLGALFFLMGFVSNVWSTSLRQMDLERLMQNSDQIFRATVLSATRGSVRAGGGTIPTLTYDLQIVDSFKGQDGGIAHITMVTSPPESSADGIARFPMFRDLPRLSVGKDYVLFVTRPSALGLCTTVGLGQGCFDIRVQDNKEVAVNRFNNTGLGLDGPAGPVAYEKLSAAIHTHDSE